MSIKYPTSVGDFNGKQASDGYFMYAVIDANLIDDAVIDYKPIDGEF
jgi:hypothetical protein